MEIIEALRSRRSIKSFAPDPVPQSILMEVIDAARHSPSGANRNPWRFVIVSRRETLDRLSQAHANCRWLGTAQAGIAIAADPATSRYWLEDCCVAAYSVWLASTAKGLGVAWSAIYQSDNAEENMRRQRFVKEALAIPDHFQVPIVLGLGYPQASPPTRKLPSLEEIVSWEQYAPSTP